MQSIVKSMLDTDWYKITMGQVVFNQFPEAIVEYDFINRGKTKFPTGFDTLLRQQLDMMSLLRMHPDEHQWLKKTPYIKPSYADWFASYHYNPNEVTISQKDNDLFIRIRGPGYRTIHWEVALLATISELYYRCDGIVPIQGWDTTMVEKAKFLHAALCHWSDFGTRRRFSFEVQRKLVEIMREYSGFHGTSNPYLAFMYDVVPIGTYAHEAPMAMQAKYGARMSNRMWNEAWVKEYRGDLGIALTDTLTTPAFLKDFDMMFSKLFDGMRQDSGDPYKIGEEYVKHYHSMRINPKSKRVIFSDSLDCKKGADLNKSFMDWVQPFLGIGTHLTNDVGAKPLNMVIKMISADFGHGMRPVVKLSDNVGKVTGLPEAVEHVKWEMGL